MTDLRPDTWALYRCQPGEDTFAMFYEQTRRLAWTICRRILRDDEDAADAFQSVYTRALALARDPHADPALAQLDDRHVILRLAAREADALRKRRGRHHAREIVVETLPERPTADLAAVDLAAASQLRERLDSLIEALPETYRLPLQLHFLHGLTQREVADALEKPPGTIAVTIARGLRKLEPLARRAGLADLSGLLLILSGSTVLLSPPGALAAAGVFVHAQAAVAAGASAVTPAVATPGTGASLLGAGGAKLKAGLAIVGAAALITAGAVLLPSRGTPPPTPPPVVAVAATPAPPPAIRPDPPAAPYGNFTPGRWSARAAVAPTSPTQTNLFEITGELVEEVTFEPVRNVWVEVCWAGHNYDNWRGEIDWVWLGDTNRFTLRTRKPPSEPFQFRVMGKGAVAFLSQEFPATPADPIRLVMPSRPAFVVARTVDDTGRPVRNAGTVMLYRHGDLAGGEGVLTWTKPDENGYAVFGPVAPGEYSVYHTDHYRRSAMVRTAALSDVDSFSSPVEIVFSQVGAVEILVRDAGGKPVETFELATAVKAIDHTGDGGGYPKPRVAPGGRLLLEGLAPGRYAFAIQSDRGDGWAHVYIPLPTPDSPIATSVTLSQPSAWLQGVLLEADGRPTSGGTVVIGPNLPTLADGVGIPFRRDLRTDAAGFFRSPLVAAGDYRVYLPNDAHHAAVTTYAKLAPGVATSVTLTRVAQEYGLRQFEGRVTDSAGRPVPGVAVIADAVVNQQRQKIETSTNSDGSYKVELPIPGAKTAFAWLQFIHPDYCPWIRNARPPVPPQEIERLDVVLHPRAELPVELVQTAGTEPLINQLLTLGVLPIDAERATVRFGTRGYFGGRFESLPFRYPPEKLLPVPRGVPFKIDLMQPKLLHAILLNGDDPIATDTLRIPDVPGDYRLRVIVDAAPAREQFYLRILNDQTNKPLGGIKVENFSSAEDGLLVTPHSRVYFDNAIPIRTTAGKIGDPFQKVMNLPTGAGPNVRDPVVIHVRPLRTNGYAYVYALDRHGRQISDLVTIDDGGIVRKLGTAFYRNCYLDTEPGVHHLQFSMKPGEVEPIALVDPPANTAASIIDLDGYPVLRVIWPAGATPAPLTVRLTNWPRDPTPPPGPDPFEDQYPIIPTPFPGR